MFRTGCVYLLIATQLTLGFTGCRCNDPYWGTGIHTPQPTVPLPSKLACYDGQPVTAEHIPLVTPYSADPRIPLDPNKAPHWNLTLHEAVTTALDNSEVVRTSSLVETFSKVDGVTGRISVYEPQIADTERVAALGAFDTNFATSMFWNKTELPLGTSFGGIGSRPPVTHGATFLATLSQPTTLGTTVYGDFSTNYLFIPPPFLGPTPNPQYFSNLSIGIRQPLMQGFGKGVNLAPVGIAAAKATQSVWEFKQESMALVRSVESAYWGLYAAQKNVQVIEDVIPMYEEVLRLEKRRVEADAATPQDAARADSDLLNYRQQLLEARSNVAAQQLVLRELMGLQPSDGRYLVLVDAPSSTPLQLDWDSTVEVALDSRPDLLRHRLGVHVAELQLLVARNGYRPRLDLDGRFGKNGMGSDVGAPLGQIGEGLYDEWQMGVTFSTPLQRHVGIAGIREAELTIARERAFLKNAALIATTEVADAMRRIEWVQQQYVVAEQRVAAVREWRKGAQARFTNPPADLSLVLALELYLRNLQALVESSLAANQLLADYNNAIARLEEVKGTILESHTVFVQRDPSEEVIKKLGPTDREVNPKDLPTPDDPQGARPRQQEGNGETVELRDFRIRPRVANSALVPFMLSEPTPAEVIDGDARAVPPSGPGPAPSVQNPVVNRDAELSGSPAAADRVPVLQSSSRQAAGPIASSGLATAPQLKRAPQVNSRPPQTSAPAATAAPHGAATASKPTAADAATSKLHSVAADSQPAANAARPAASTAPVVQQPTPQPAVAKPSLAKKSVSPLDRKPVTAASAAGPAADPSQSVTLRTVAAESSADSKPAPISSVGPRYGSAERVPPTAEQAAATQQANPLRSLGPNRKPVRGVSAAAPAVHPSQSATVRTVAAESSVDTKPAPVSSIGPRYGSAERVPPTAEQAAAAQQPNPLRGTESTAELPGSLGDNPFRR